MIENTESDYKGNIRGEELKKKVMMTAAVLCLGLLLVAGSRMASSIQTKAYNILAPVDDRAEEKLIPFSSNGRTGMYVIPGTFEESFEGPYGRSWAELAMDAVIDWEAFPAPEEENGVLALPYEESEKRLNELTAFCKEHKEKLNEISEYLINAAENISDYQDGEPLLDAEELAGMFTDEKSREILEKLKPYYLVGFDAEEGFGSFKGVSYYYPYDDDYDGEYTYPDYMAFYLKGDKEKFLDFFSGRRYWITQEIDEHLFAVMESLPYV